MIKQKIQREGTTVPTPSVNEVVFYPKIDGYYYKDSHGLEHRIGTVQPITLLISEALKLIMSNTLSIGAYYFLSDTKVLLMAATSNSFMPRGSYFMSRAAKAYCILSVDSVGSPCGLDDITINGISLFNGTGIGDDLDRIEIVGIGRENPIVSEMAARISDIINDNSDTSGYSAFSCSSFVCIVCNAVGDGNNGLTINFVNAVNVGISVYAPLQGGSGVNTEIMECIYDIAGLPKSGVGFLSEIYDCKRNVRVKVDEPTCDDLGRNPILEFDFMNDSITNSRFKNCYNDDETTQMILYKSTIDKAVFDGVNYEYLLFDSFVISNTKVNNISWSNCLLSQGSLDQSYIDIDLERVDFIGLNFSMDTRLLTGSVYCKSKILSGSDGLIVGFIPADCFVYEAVISFGDLDDDVVIDLGTDDTPDGVLTGNSTGIKNTKLLKQLSDMSLSMIDDVEPIYLSLDTPASKDVPCSFLFKFSK